MSVPVELRSSSSYLSVLVPSEGSCNPTGNKFRASAGRREESGAGSCVRVAGGEAGVAEDVRGRR